MPAAARKGDSGVVHCSGFNIASGSGDVFINGQSAARKGDTSSAHKRPGSPCPTHTSSIAGGSSSVFIFSVASQSAAPIGLVAQNPDMDPRENQPATQLFRKTHAAENNLIIGIKKKKKVLHTWSE